MVIIKLSVLVISAQNAPANLDYAVWRGTVSSATPPFAGVGSTTNVGLTLGNFLSFDATGQAGSGAVGTYTYTRTGPNTASYASVRTNLSPVFPTTQIWTFTSPNAGVWTTTGTYGGFTGAAQGSFTLTILEPRVIPATNTGIGLVEIYELSREPASTHRIVNIATRGFVGTDSSALFGGFVIGGTEFETVLIRGDGPSLGLPPFNLSGVLTQPMITLYDSSGQVVASNAGWGTRVVVGASTIAARVGVNLRLSTAADFTSCGAFPWAAGSADSAMTATLPPGAYSVVVTGK